MHAPTNESGKRFVKKDFAVLLLGGAAMIVLSTWPLVGMTDLPLHSSGQPRASLRSQLLSPLTDQKFRRLLWFGLWFSFSNGLMQSARWMFQVSVLQMTFVEKKVLDAGSRGVQSLLMPSVGDWVDRRGNVSVLAFPQGIIALAPLFFLIATPETRWWIVGAYVCWLAYAGENVAQPNLMPGPQPIRSNGRVRLSMVRVDAACLFAQRVVGRRAIRLDG